MNGSAIIEAEVEIRDDRGELVTSVGGEDASRRVQMMRPSEKYRSLLGDANSKVNVNLSESLGGPYGYSSVKLSVSVTLTCNQDPDTIQLAKQYCMDECLDFLDGNIGAAYKMLNDHLKRHYDGAMQ